MISETDTAVIGAGPYGLSVAAHLHHRRADFRVFGRPLDTWRTAMPRGMYLKSDGFASNLSAPEPGATLADYCLERGLPYHPTDEPVPLETFVDYGLDFQRRYVPDLDERTVTSVVRNGRGFRLALDDGEELRAKQVVVAAGITHFASMPQLVDGLPPELVSHSSTHRDLERFEGQQVTVIGAGASAVNLAVWLARAGARSRLVTRAPSVHFSSPPTGGRRGLLARLHKPGSGLGPGWRSRASCDAPDLFRLVPARWRPEIVRRHLGPSSAWHLKEPFESSVEVITSRSLQRVTAVDDGVRIVLASADGRPPLTLESDHVICATGYRADLQRLGFLDPALRSEVRALAKTPVLSRHFESSVPGLYFLGLSAAVSFGPMMRFMFGDSFAARRITQDLVRCAA
ncbi:MAG TPA: NAD(P)-binding domain-containing protein [Nocardioides sp.]|uniref:NAD(P)-binding domain-containing protein n=1 Tax=Nocardioides sp. TaxID=35761 RepID=UPI002E2F57D7|nr:NAD(P)-binding domain-containing protein [Nocardioides sp.]HEX5089008.1 NAD(P)-binding domain-containing protein [Nocardioides sp.]